MLNGKYIVKIVINEYWLQASTHFHNLYGCIDDIKQIERVMVLKINLQSFWDSPTSNGVDAV